MPETATNGRLGWGATQFTIEPSACARKTSLPETALQMDGVALQALSLLQLALSVPALLEPTEEESLFRLLATLNALLEVEGMLVTAKELELHVTLGALALSAAAPPKTVACKEAALKLLTK
jgi:hypothetical protein